MECTDVGVLRVVYLVKNIINIIRYIVPILLIIWSMLDIIKLIVSDMKSIPTSVKKTVGKFIAAVIVFLVPSMVNIIMSVLHEQNIQVSTCWVNATKEGIAAAKENSTSDDYEISQATQAEINQSLEKRKKLFEGENGSNGGSQSGINQGGSIAKFGETTSFTDMPYFNQAATGLWGSVPYCGSGRTLHTSGCGALTIAMAFSKAGGVEVTPKEIAEWICGIGGHSGGATPDYYFMNPTLLQKYSIIGNVIVNGSESVDDKKRAIENAINSGKTIIVKIPGHFVAATKSYSGKIAVLDPGARGYNGEYTVDEFYNFAYNYKGRCNSSLTSGVSSQFSSALSSNQCGFRMAWAYERRNV